jgi:2-C-methyl-D-erythritol 4-phosphate cytidylyltransferase
LSIADARTGVSCLIPAAGAGLRLGQGTKGFLSLSGRPLLCWVADKALQVADEVIVAVPADRLEVATRLLPRCRVLAGGGSRHDSVALLAEQARGDWLLLHDVARPFASVGLLQRVIEAARATDCAGAFVDPEVPVARLRDGFAVESLPRHEAGVFQSPQAFRRSDLLSLIERERVEGWQPQSTMQLALRAGLRVAAVAGEKTNIKITTPRRLAARARCWRSTCMSSGNLPRTQHPELFRWSPALDPAATSTHATRVTSVHDGEATALGDGDGAERGTTHDPGYVEPDAGDWTIRVLRSRRGRSNRWAAAGCALPPGNRGLCGRQQQRTTGR